MSSVQYLRSFVTERLTAAAQEICGVLEKTIVEYEEEIGRQRRLLDMVLKPEIKLHTIELPKQRVCKAEDVLTDQQLCNQERRSSLDQVDPEPPQIIEERGELCSSQRGEDLLLKQETDTFMLIPTIEESDHSESLPNSDHQVLSNSSPVAESQDQEGSQQADSGSTKKAEPEPKKICHIIKSDNNNRVNTLVSGARCDIQTEVPRQHVCKEEEVLTDQQLYNQERNSNLDQEDPEPPEIKEEQEEHCISQSVEELVPKNETENFMLIPPYEESDHQLLSESQQGDSGSARTLQLKPNRQHINTSHNKNVDNSLVSETHCDAHTGKRSFTCGTCGKMFKYKSAFDIHLRIHTGEKPYVCNTCGKRFTRVSALNVHLRIHTGERPYFCKICRNTFTFRSGLLAHIRTHSCEKTYSCLGCNKAFKDSHDLKSHMQTHTGKSPYTCNKCGKRFSDTSSVRQHIKTHKGEKTYPCHICSTRFIYGHDLKTHMKTHTGEKPYSCKTCGKRFSAAKLLKSHMKVHTTVNAYVCETCGKCFTFSSNLWVHLKTHTGEKPYSCKTCGKGFLCSRDLKGHMRTHTGEKPYACNTCGTRFGCSASLKRHSRIHTGERPYSCDICGRSFTHNSSFLAHRRTHTGESPTPAIPVGKDALRCRTSEDA